MNLFFDLPYKLPVPRFLLRLGFEDIGRNSEDQGYLRKQLSDRTADDTLIAWISPPGGEYKIERETYWTQQEHRFEILYNPAGTWEQDWPMDGIQVLIYAGDSALECTRAIKYFLQFRNGQPIDATRINERLPSDFNTLENCPLELLITSPAPAAGGGAYP